MEVVGQQVSGAQLAAGPADIGRRFEGFHREGYQVVEVQNILAAFLLVVLLQHVVPVLLLGGQGGVHLPAGLVQAVPGQYVFYLLVGQGQLVGLRLYQGLGDLDGLVRIPDGEVRRYA